MQVFQPYVYYQERQKIQTTMTDSFLDTDLNDTIPENAGEVCMDNLFRVAQAMVDCQTTGNTAPLDKCMPFADRFLKTLIQKNGLRHIKPRPLPEAQQRIVDNIRRKRKHCELEDDHLENLPSSVKEFSKFLQTLYLESLYTQKWRLIDFMTQIKRCVDRMGQDPEGLSELLGALKSTARLCLSFDQKHRQIIPSMMLDGEVAGNFQLPDTEQDYFEKWHAETIGSRLQHIRDYDDLSRKALKIRDGKLQIILYLFIVAVERRAGRRQCASSEKEIEGEKRLDLDDSEYQLSLYFNLINIWESVADISGFLQDVSNGSMSGPRRDLDAADSSVLTFCNHLEQGLGNLVPDWIEHFIGKCKEDDLEYIEPEPVVSLPQDKENRAPRKSPTKAASTPTSSQSSSASGKAPAMPEFPFLRRQVDLTVKNKTSKQKTVGPAAAAAIAKVARSAKNGVPTMKRSGSFLKSADSPKRSKILREHNNDDVTLQLRIPDSPTTPRTRYQRMITSFMEDYKVSPRRSDSFE